MIQSAFGKNKSEHFVMMIHYRTNFGNCTIFFQLDVQYHVLFGNCCLTKKMKPNLIYLKYNLTLFRTIYRKTINDNVYIYINVCVYMNILTRSFKRVSPLSKSHIWFVVSSRSGLQICHGFLLWYCNTYHIICLNNSYFFLQLM